RPVVVGARLHWYLQQRPARASREQKGHACIAEDIDSPAMNRECRPFVQMDGHIARTLGDRGDQLLAPAIVEWAAGDDRAGDDIEQWIVAGGNDDEFRL